MQKYPFYYEMLNNNVPFSTIRGGFSSFEGDTCPPMRPRTSTPDFQNNHTSEILWRIKTVPAGDVFSVRQVCTSQRTALTSERALEKGQVYETLDIITSVSSNSKLRRPEQPVTQTGQSTGICQHTHIMTIKGEVPVENLRIGDLIVTRDRGMQPLLWIGTAAPSASTKFVVFSKDSINNSRDMTVSPNQLVVLKGSQALLRYGQREVLIAARTFVNGDDIHYTSNSGRPFYQLLLPAHAVIYAEAAAMESYLPSAQNLALLAPRQKQSVFKALPSLQNDPGSYGPLARHHVGETIH